MLRRLSAGLLAVTVIALVAAFAIGFRDYLRRDATPPPPKVAAIATPPPATGTPSPAATATPTPAPLPPSVLIASVPYTVQAPDNDWDAAHEEYCEAAAVTMVGLYYQGVTYADNVIPAATADADMAGIVAWERQTFPGQLNLSLADMAQDGLHFYGLQSSIQPLDLTAIQRYLANGQPVIIPVMTHGGPGGSMINPHYGSENVYHVIVLVGYNAAQGIVYTNDAGINQGQNLAYAWTTLQTAVQSMVDTPVDQSGIPVPTSQGASMLVFSKGRTDSPSSG
ncbi:MAG: C39 family peptidase [Candidatus Dormibacteraceae bacterium]